MGTCTNVGTCLSCRKPIIAPILPKSVALPLEVVLRPNIPVPTIWKLTVKSRPRRNGVKYDEDAQSDTTMAFPEKGVRRR